MLQVGQGQPERLAVLFGRHHLKLFNFFRKLGNSRPASEDLVQDTFFRMLRFAASYREAGHFLAWMYRIARNAAASASSRHDREVLLDTEALDELPTDNQATPDQLHALHEMEQRLQRALLRLSDDQRALVLLSRVRELGTEELAQMFDCSGPAVKVRLHRSLALLREYFAAEGVTGPYSTREPL